MQKAYKNKIYPKSIVLTDSKNARIVKNSQKLKIKQRNYNFNLEIQKS